jgi:hypothetical protein
MKEILDLTIQLRQKSNDYGKEVAESLRIDVHKQPAGVFPMIFNKHTVLLELLSHYFDAWKKATTTKCSSIEEARKENAERVILIQKLIFIQSMSAIEYCCKNYVKTNPKKISQIKSRIYLRRIMEESKNRGIVSDLEFTLWEGAIELRNSLVHNNGISEKTAEYNFPKCKLKIYKDKMIQGNLKLFPNITDWLLDATKYWLIEMEKK